jgi:hypothetical protein
VERRKGVPKERKVDRRREICEWHGCVCVCEAIRVSSMFRLIHRTVELVRM